MNSSNVTGGTGGQGAGEHGKVRLYELAKDLGLANKELVEKVRALGIDVKNHMSNLDVEEAARVKRALDKERQSNLVEERLSSTVIRRRSKDGGVVAARPATPAAREEERSARPSAPAKIERPRVEEKPVEVAPPPPPPPRRIVIEQPSRGERPAPIVQEKRSSAPPVVVEARTEPQVEAPAPTPPAAAP